MWEIFGTARVICWLLRLSPGKLTLVGRRWTFQILCQSMPTPCTWPPTMPHQGTTAWTGITSRVLAWTMRRCTLHRMAAALPTGLMSTAAPAASQPALTTPQTAGWTWSSTTNHDRIVDRIDHQESGLEHPAPDRVRPPGNVLVSFQGDRSGGFELYGRNC